MMPVTDNVAFIRHLALRNFLSFGPENPGIELNALNVFIGPNGCGKSNLIDAINFMRSGAKDFRTVVREGGGVAEWIWKGDPHGIASMAWTLEYPKSSSTICHTVSFLNEQHKFRMTDERIEEIGLRNSSNGSDLFNYRYQNGNPVVNINTVGERVLAGDTVEPDRSIIAQRQDPEGYPELTWLAQNYGRIRIYREWEFGRKGSIRWSQQADLRNDYLEEDFSNLGLVLNKLRSRFPAAKRAILEGLADLYDGLTDFDVSVEAGRLQVYFTDGEYSIPANRISDGTLRYLCLLVILCDPEPPPLICIEEPELGLHPDILPKVADLLRAASERTQVIVTTHSDILVDAVTETPEAVVVCSKSDRQTLMERLNPDDLAPWLEKYRLGQLWTQGQIGGNRW